MFLGEAKKRSQDCKCMAVRRRSHGCKHNRYALNIYKFNCISALHIYILSADVLPDMRVPAAAARGKDDKKL